MKYDIYVTERTVTLFRDIEADSIEEAIEIFEDDPNWVDGRCIDCIQEELDVIESKENQ